MTVYFFTTLTAYFLGTWYEKPPHNAVMQGVAVIVPTTAPTQPQSKYLTVGDTVFVTGLGWAKITDLQPEIKGCVTF